MVCLKADCGSAIEAARINGSGPIEGVDCFTMNRLIPESCCYSSQHLGTISACRSADYFSTKVLMCSILMVGWFVQEYLKRKLICFNALIQKQPPKYMDFARV